MDGRNDMNTTLVVRDGYPPVYRMTMDQPEELYELYLDILGRSTVDQVQEKMISYVTEVIEPIGWRAIWRSNTKSSPLDFQADFEVDVMDVSQRTLEADIVAKSILAPEKLTNKQQHQIDSMTKDYETGKDKVITVPLIELYVISEGDEDTSFGRTAVVVEHIRFFYRHLWRAWDGVTGSNDVFSDTRLLPRLNLYFDIQAGIVPPDMVVNIKQLLAESWRIRQELDDLSNKMEKLMASDEPTEEDEQDPAIESDVFEGMRLRVSLENIERELKLLEDPFTRMVATKSNSSLDSDTLSIPSSYAESAASKDTISNNGKALSTITECTETADATSNTNSL